MAKNTEVKAMEGDVAVLAKQKSNVKKCKLGLGKLSINPFVLQILTA